MEFVNNKVAPCHKLFIGSHLVLDKIETFYYNVFDSWFFILQKAKYISVTQNRKVVK